jgi:hypothetical protein
VIFNTLKAFMSECYMSVDNQRAKISQMSAGGVVFLELRLYSRIFDSYRLTPPDKHLSIDNTENDTKRILTGLSKAKITDTVTIKASQASIDLHFEK